MTYTSQAIIPISRNAAVTKHPVIHQDAMVRVLKRSDMTYTPASIGISSNRIKAIVSIAWVVRKASFLYEISTEDSTQTLVQMRVFHSPTLVVVPPLAPIIQEGVDQATTWKREASARHPRESLAHPEAYPQHAMATVSRV